MWTELKNYGPIQDGDASCPLEVDGVDFSDITTKLEKIEDELEKERTDWYFYNKFARQSDRKYYPLRFKHHFKSFGFGAYNTWWTLEGWDVEPEHDKSWDERESSGRNV